MAEQGTNHVVTAGWSDKRCITSRSLLLLQVIYKGKTERCLPRKAGDDKRFLLPLMKNILVMKVRYCYLLMPFYCLILKK